MRDLKYTHNKSFRHLNKYSELYYTLCNEPWAHASNMNYLVRPFKYVAERVKEGIFLDMGSGVGNILEYAKTVFPKMVMKGIEKHPEYTEVAKEYGEIKTGGILMQRELIKTATVLYTYEPMEASKMEQLMIMLEGLPNWKYLILNAFDFNYGCTNCLDKKYNGKLYLAREYLDPSMVKAKQNIRVYANTNTIIV